MNDDTEFPSSAMIALLPTTTDWCKIALPHMTLVYAGDITKLQPTDYNRLAKDAAAIAMMTRSLTLEVLGKEPFGNWSTDPNAMVDVFRLRATPELLALRHMVDSWNASEFDFNPHVTIGPASQNFVEQPRYLTFDKVYVGWGNDGLTFNMKP